MKNITFCLLMLYGVASHAQLIVSNTLETPAQLVQNVLVDASVVPLNIKFNGSAANANVIRDQAAHFTTNFNPTNLGLTEGVLLTTGKSQAALGPNNAAGFTLPSTFLPYYADTDLANLTTNTVVNSAVLEFDFVATGLELNFEFVFASEEYPEYANTGFNDVFGFFLTGPGNPAPYVSQNIAIIPMTSVPITINNLNNGSANAGPCEYCAYYVNNGTGVTPIANYSIQYDGFTTVLSASATLVCGETYHMKMGVGNVGDNSYDSAVFLKNFKIKPLVLLANNSNVPVCKGLPVEIASGVAPNDYTFVWTENGTLLPAETGPNLDIPAGSEPAAVNAGTFVPMTKYQIQTAGTTDFTLIGAADNLPGTIFTATGPGTGTGTAAPISVYELNYYTALGCLLGKANYDLIYYIDPLKEPVSFNICTALPAPYSFGNIDQTTFILNGEPNFNYDIAYFHTLAEAEMPVPPPGISAAELSNYFTNNTAETIYVRFEDLVASGCIYIKSFDLSAGLTPSGTYSYPGTPYCAALSTQPITTTVTPGGSYAATPAGLTLDSTTGAINPSTSTPGNYTVNYALAASGTCPAFNPPGVPVSITATPAAPIVATPLTYCQNETAPTLSATGTNLLWYAAAAGGTGSVTAPTPNTAMSGSKTYYVSQTNGCEGPRAVITVNVTATPAAPTFTAPSPYCQNAVATPLSATGTALLWYAAATGGVGNATAPTPSTAASGNVNYYVTQTVNGCESPRAMIPVSTIALPAAPGVTSPIGYCQNAVAVALTATGNNLIWYATAAGGVGSSAAPIPGTATVTNTTYYVSQTVSGCEGPRAAIVVNVSAIPATPTFTITQPTCTTNSATIVITSPTGINLEYSINNGVSFQTGTSFTAVAAGTSYDVVVKNTISGCVSAIAQAVVNPALPIPVAPTVSTTVQPNCNIPTGTIVITAPTGVNLEYTINNGTTYQTSTTFTGLTPNANYTISVRDANTGCTSSATVVNVNAITANPIMPTINITSPNCNIPTATISITAPTGANLEYSLNNGVYQSGTTFSGLLPGSNYSIIAHDIATGCASLASTGIINSIPANPAIPTFTMVQPTCAINTGSFTITAPIGANFQYSNNGGTTFQVSATFSGLAAGTTYNAIVKDMLTGCISTPANVVIAPALNVPAAPTISVTVQPICTTPFGTIVISAPTGANLSYSINGGTTFQTGTTFSGLAPNTTFNVIVKDNTSGCISNASSAVVSPLPANPAAPTASATVQPNCINPTGMIVVTAPIGVNFEYSINGGATYQWGLTFASLAPNATYNITVRNIVTGCISVPTAIVISPIPTNPVAATATLVQPTCTIPTGTISITNPTGANLQYSINGGTSYQTAAAFGPLAPGTTYNILVKNTVTGCISAPASFVIIPAPTFPATPILNATPVCLGESIMLTTTAAATTYQWTGPNGFTSSQQNPVIQNSDLSMAGVYSLIIATTSDCPSLPGTTTVVVNPLPNPTLAQNGNICFNSETNVVTDPYTLDSGLSSAQYSFEWFTESGGTFSPILTQTQSTYVVVTPGTYGVRATNLATGCVSGIVSATVTMTSPPLRVVAIASDYFQDLQTITVVVEPVGIYEYQLDNGAFQSGNLFSDVTTGQHIVNVRNSCGVNSGSASLIDYPKFFTPNGDGYNDTWNIFALKDQANAKIYIFDRYGKFLKEISPKGKGWDGNFNEQSLPSTDYWFIVHYEENKVNKIFKSHFALKR